MLKDASEIKFEFDFLKIDSWDDWQNDSLHVVFNDKVVDLGTFHAGRDESGRRRSSHGIKHVLEAKTPANQNIGFARYQDQILHVTMRIPNSYFKSDGRLKVEFRATVTQKLDNESAGFDNIQITAEYDCIDFCVPTSTVSFEDFEDGKAAGWVNGRTQKEGAFTKFLGRYGKNMPSPRKTYTVPRKADAMKLSFDFYEIDSWNENQDYFRVRIDDKSITIGTFSSTEDEDGRSGMAHDVSYSLKSAGAPTNIGFTSKSNDQIHHVSMWIPKSFFEVDGKLKIEFQTTFTADIDNESAGFDNIRISAEYNCVDECASANMVSFEDFEDGKTAGWINGNTTKEGAFTEFLGRYAIDQPSPRKTYTVPKDASEIKLEFDFYEIDSWDGNQDYFRVRIDDKAVNIGTFSWWYDEDGRYGKVNGISYIFKSERNSNIGFTSKWLDQIHHVTMRIPKSFFEVDGKLKIEFQTTFSSDIDNESVGFDNIEITAMYGCDGRRLALLVMEGDEIVDVAA